MRSIMIIISVLFGFVCITRAQLDAVWVLGHTPNEPADSLGGTLLQFTTEGPIVSYVPLPDDFNQVGSAAIADGNGALQFYTNGCRIYTQEHTVMEGVMPINEGYWSDLYCGNSSFYPLSQGLLALPLPEQEGQYALFHLRYNADGFRTDLLYTHFDMLAGGGEGHVSFTDSPIGQDTFADQLAAIRHGNGRDWWILVPESYTNGYFRYLLSPSGISGPEYQQIGAVWNLQDEAGQATFSSQGDRYARVNPANGLHFFDFDRCSGLLSNPQTLQFAEITGAAAGLSFSPNGRYLYVSFSYQLFQFDLWADNWQSTQVLIGEYDGFLSPYPTTFYQHRLAPDGKIYLSSSNAVNRLHIIHHPNQAGAACQLEQHGLRLPTAHSFALPNFPIDAGSIPGGTACDSLGTADTMLVETAAADKKRRCRVIPNPTHEWIQLTVARSPENQPLLWQLYNAVGEEVLWLDIRGENRRFSVTHLPAGHYWWSLSANGQRLDMGSLVIVD